MAVEFHQDIQSIYIERRTNFDITFFFLLICASDRKLSELHYF